MSQCVHCRQSLVHVLRHELAHEVLCLVTDVGPDLAAEFPIPFADFVQDLLIAAVEGRRAAKHDVKDDTNTPHVALLVVVARKHFWGDVVGRSVDGMHLLAFFSVVVRSSKVDYLYGSLLVDVDEEVLRLEVTMSDVFAVAIGDCLQNLLGHMGCLLLGELLS